MPMFSKHLCHFCKNFIWCEYECKEGHFLEETDEHGDLMIVTECDDFRGEE